MTRNSRLGDYVTQLTAESRATLAAWLWADQLLYNHFLGRHEARLRQFGQERMAGAVATLRSLNEDLRKVASYRYYKLQESCGGLDTTQAMHRMQGVCSGGSV